MLDEYIFHFIMFRAAGWMGVMDDIYWVNAMLGNLFYHVEKRSNRLDTVDLFLDQVFHFHGYHLMSQNINVQSTNGSVSFVVLPRRELL